MTGCADQADHGAATVISPVVFRWHHWIDLILAEESYCDTIPELLSYYKRDVLFAPAICKHCKTVCRRGRCDFRYCWTCGELEGVCLYDELIPRSMLQMIEGT